MKTLITSAVLLLTLTSGSLLAQETTIPPEPVDASTTPAASDADDAAPKDESAPTGESSPGIAEKAKEAAADAEGKVDEIVESIDQNETAKKAAAGILEPIYKLAETLSFSAFHWVAFALMCSGVVSFAMQLVLGKLVVLFKGSINLREILSDFIGLIISVVGLVLTTQAAAENSNFTNSAAAVLSAAGLGAVVGILLYRWGQAQEVNAVVGQRVKQPRKI